MNLVNQLSLPPVDRRLDGRNAFADSLAWPENQQRVAALLKRGEQQE